MITEFNCFEVSVRCSTAVFPATAVSNKEKSKQYRERGIGIVLIVRISDRRRCGVLTIELDIVENVLTLFYSTSKDVVQKGFSKWFLIVRFLFTWKY